MRRAVFAWSVASAVAVSAWSCSDSGDPTANEIAEVAIIAINRTTLVGKTVQAEGRAITNGGDRVDGLVTWTVSNQNIISVTAELITTGPSIVNRATVTGVSVGSANLIATVGAKSASVLIVVSNAPP